MAWIRAESSNLKKIKVQGMDDDVHFTDLRYAEVSSDVASLLSTLDGVSSVAEPATPGEYYGSDVDNNVITVEVVSDTFDDITVLGRADVSLVDTGELSVSGYNHVTKEDKTIAVPGDYSTLQEAIDAVEKHARDEVVIDIEPGLDLSDEFPVMRGVRAEGYTTGTQTGVAPGELGIVQIQGDPDNPPLVGGFDAVNCGLSARLFDIEFTGNKLANDTSKTHLEEEACVAFSNCTGGAVFNCSFRNGDSSKAVWNYLGVIECRGTDFGQRNFDVLVRTKNFAHTAVTNCTGEPNIGGGLVVNDPRSTVQISGGDLGSAADSEHLNPATISEKLLSAEYLPFAFFDDFGDNSLKDRDTANVGRYATPEDGVFTAVIRPQWFIESGTPTVNNHVLVLDGNEGVIHASQFSTGEWRGRFKFQTTPSGGNNFRNFMMTDGAGNSWTLNFTYDGNINLRKKVNGTVTTALTSTWTPDTTVHDWRVTRDRNGNWEVFFDGTSIGTITDAFLPTRPTKIQIKNTITETVEVHDITLQ